MGQLLALAIHYFASLLIYLIVARAILSWFPEPRNDGPLRQLYYFVLRLAHVLTDPVVGPIRNLIRKSPLGGPGMVLDFSPIIAIVLINFARTALIQFVVNLF